MAVVGEERAQKPRRGEVSMDRQRSILGWQQDVRPCTRLPTSSHAHRSRGYPSAFWTQWTLARCCSTAVGGVPDVVTTMSRRYRALGDPRAIRRDTGC